MPIAQRNYANTVENNYIDRAAVEYEGGIGIWFGLSDHASILHNEITNLSYTGISVGWGWSGYTYPTGSYANNNLIEHNWVHEVMQTLSDGGGIYTLSFQPSSRVTGNFLQNLGPFDTNAIYHDEGSRFFTSRSNVVSGAHRWLSMWINTVLNNSIQYNYADYDVALCNGTQGPSQTWCNFSNGDPSTANVVNSNTFTNGGPWPAAAQAIINNAGLESAYIGIKSPVCGDATCNNAESSMTCAKDCAP